jgi:glycosyltransferase involved in cell wall biosynthesis
MTAPLRFCMFSTFYPPYSYGGDGITLQRLCRALVRAGHEVTVVHDADAFRSLGHPEPNAVPAGDGVQIVTLRSSLGVVSVLLTYEFGQPVVHRTDIENLLARGRFDVVHFHNASLVGGPGLFALARGSATIYTAHEHWLICPTHVLWRHGRERCTGRECFRCTLHYGRPPQLWRSTGLLERSLDDVDTFIALSEFSRAKHREFGFPRDMAVLPPIVFDADAESIDAPAVSPHPRPYFFYAGRLERIKGLDDVLPLFRDADAPADLLIAGAGAHEPALRAIAGGSPHIHFLGHLPPDRLAPLYRYAIAHIASSVCFETFGNTLVEAFRQRTPVIARNIGPFPEIVAHAGAGELFDDAQGLRAALVRFASDRAHRDRLGAAGRAAYEATWSEEAIIPRYLDIIERTMARRRVPALSAAPVVAMTQA